MLEEVGSGLRVVVEDAIVALVDKAEMIMDVVEDHTKLIRGHQISEDSSTRYNGIGSRDSFKAKSGDGRRTNLGCRNQRS